MYFAASVKVDLDIAGNQTARRLGGGVGGEEKNSRLGRAIVRRQNRHTTQAIVWRSLDSLRKQTFLLAHRSWGTFRAEERLRLSDRNSMLMT